MSEEHIISAKLPVPGGFQTMYYNPDRSTAWSPNREDAKVYRDEGLAKVALRGFQSARCPRDRLEAPIKNLDAVPAQQD